MSRAKRRALVEREAPALPVSRQCRLLSVSRASVYRRLTPVSEEDCTIMRLIDRQYLVRPYYRWAAPRVMTTPDVRTPNADRGRTRHLFSGTG